MEATCNGMEQQSSFGIKKIVDCRIGEGGEQLYKVKWEATWEPAENLASCQHLIDEFWFFVNKAKVNEEVAQQHRKRIKLGQNTNTMMNIERLSEENKAEVQRLISRTNTTSVGSQMLMSPSNMLDNMSSPPHNQHNNNIMINFSSPQLLQSFGDGSQLNLSFPGQNSKSTLFASKGNTSTGTLKTEQDNSFKNKSTAESGGANSKLPNTASLKYLENFSNPYVKVIVVCKICNKEASKFPNNWKSHYLTHASSEEKPHQCPFCPAGFVSLTRLTQHKEKKHANQFGCKPEYKVEGF